MLQLGDFHSSGIRGIEDWHFFIPRGSGNLDPIPRGPCKDFKGLVPLDEILTLLTADVFRDGGAVTDMRPPLLTGDLLSSLAIK